MNSQLLYWLTILDDVVTDGPSWFINHDLQHLQISQCEVQGSPRHLHTPMARRQACDLQELKEDVEKFRRSVSAEVAVE